MRLELQQQGANVQFVAINAANANKPADQKSLTDRCSFPVFQDTDSDGAWTHHSGQKDDFYIFDSEGKLAVYLPISGSVSVDLSKPEGYNNLKSRILQVK